MHARVWKMVCLALLGLPALASAGAPTPDTRRGEFRHVCAAGPLAGDACDPDIDASCGTTAAGAAHPCVLDVLKRPLLRGILTVAFDENPADNVSLPGNPAVHALLEIKLKGKTWLFAKSFQSDAPGSWPEIAAWLPPSSEDDIELLADSWPYQQPRLALTAFEAALEEMTEAVWPGMYDLTGRSPIIVQAGPAYAEGKAVDEFAGADVGRAIRLKVRIQYATPVP